MTNPVSFQGLTDSWNDADLNASGDNINVTFGSKWFSMQWLVGSSSGLQALGIDTVFYNSSVTVSQVFIGSTAGAQTTNVTSDWSHNFGGTNGSGGFGNFLSKKHLEGGDTEGISNFITFLLNGSSTLTANANGATMDIHVRYEQNCFGRVSDGTTNSSDSGSCGGRIPEPTLLVLLAIGLGLRASAARSGSVS